MWIGVAGGNCSGKDAAALLFAKHGYTCVSTSDIIRQEVKLRHLAPTRDSIRRVIEEWRDLYGGDVLAQKIHGSHKSQDKVVVFSLRHPKEVIFLRATHPFALIWVHADDQIRFERNISRNRENAPTTFEEFMKDDAHERKNADKRYYDIDALKDMADYTISNNGTLDDLENEVAKIVKSIEHS